MNDEMIADGIDEDGAEDVDTGTSTDTTEELVALARC
jgi:hypothetical protein